LPRPVNFGGAVPAGEPTHPPHPPPTPRCLNETRGALTFECRVLYSQVIRRLGGGEYRTGESIEVVKKVRRRRHWKSSKQQKGRKVEEGDDRRKKE